MAQRSQISERKRRRVLRGDNEDSDKQALNPGNGAMSEDEENDEFLLRERQRLCHLFMTTNMSEILLTKMDDRKIVQICSRLFPAQDFCQSPFPSVAHCVRCHENFNPHARHPNECKISHDPEQEIEYEGRSEDGGTIWSISCCGFTWTCQEHYRPSSCPQPFCFVGLHTTDPNECDYSLSTVWECDAYGCNDPETSH